jgi:malate dehydrogenase (oxaloacetate-decarboxylating)(NADP+)
MLMQRVVETVSRLNDRPIIFALSNPTEKAECSAEQGLRLVQGQGALCGGRSVS